MIVAGALLALVAGVIIGWSLASRSALPAKAAADTHKADADALRDRLAVVSQELATESERARRLPHG